MSLPAWAVKYKPIVISAVVLMMAWGVIAFTTMPRREDPEFTIRVCVVSTRWAGASAEKVEELVTDKLEQELISIEEVKLIRSTTVTGQSTVFVELEDSVDPSDIKQVWDKVRARVSQVEMPDPSLEPRVNDEFGDTAVLVLAVHQTPTQGRDEIREQDRYTYRELESFSDTVRDAIRLLPGVAKVDKFGVRQEAVYIETDLANWSQLDLTTAQLEQLAANRNIIQPGGELDTKDGHFSVRPGGEFTAIDEIAQIASVVRSDESENSVRLGELGLTVYRDYEDPPGIICRYGSVDASVPAVSLGVTMKSGSNIIDICDSALARVHMLAEVEQLLPPDISITPVSDQSKNVAKKIQDVIINVVEAVLIVVVVVYLVVGFRTAFVMAANIPVVVVITIGLISTFGVQLEQISLAALIISLGLLVDNAVQVCDQARTNQMAGMRPFEAAVDGANTLAIPMLVGTLTTMAAFMPMLFALEGGGKEYVYSLPVTVSTTLALSWVLAMTFCVVLAGLIIRADDSEESSSPIAVILSWIAIPFAPLLRKFRNSDTSGDPQPFMFRLYAATGLLAVRAKFLTLLAIIVLSVLILQLPVSSEFFPQADRDQFAIRVYLPETASIAQSDEIAMKVEDVIRKLSAFEEAGETVDRLVSMRTLVGGGGSRWHLAWDPEPPTRNFAEILIHTSDGAYTTQYAQDVRDACERGWESLDIKPIYGARVVPVEMALGPPADPLVFRVIGNGYADMATLRKITGEVMSLVKKQPETWNVNDSWGVSGYQVDVDVDKDRATLAGVTNSQVAKTLNSYYSGLRLTTFREGDHQVPVYFRLRPDDRSDISGLQESFVEGDNGKIPLSSIATFDLNWKPAKILRRNMNRSIEVSARMEPGVTGNDVVARVLKSDEMAQLQASLPLGFRIEPGGSFEESAKSAGQMLNSFGVSFVLIILCLIVQYNGWSKPMVILATLPLALVGAWFGLYLTNNSIGFMPQLGILALFGIVLNTAIIFIEFAEIVINERAQESSGDGPIKGLSREEFHDCLIDAGKQRMLPIFLTTATTVGGLIPLALSGGALWEGLAWCMIVGLMLATTLTLYLVPVLYALLIETFRVEP